MRIKFLDTIETVHKYSANTADGDVEMKFVKLRFDKDQEVDLGGTLPDWDRFAAKMVKIGHAVEAKG